MEIIATLVYKLTKDADLEQIQGTMFEGHFVEHGKALYYTDSGGAPFTVTYFQAKDDPITDLTEDMAADAAIALEQLASSRQKIAALNAGR